MGSMSPSILLTILFAPLASFVVQILFGKRLFAARDGGPNRLAGAMIPIVGVFTSLALTLIYVVPEMFEAGDPFLLPAGGDGFVWIGMGSVELRVGLMLDNTSRVLLFMVTLVCSMIHLFAAGYMKLRDGEPEPRYTRFFAYLSLFTFAMLLLVASDNLMTLFIGWELMGLCSYLLIGFYYEKKSAQDASLKAFMTTRVGDVLLFVGMAVIWTHTGSLRFEDIHTAMQSGALSGGTLTLAGLLCLGGAVGKSAQFPLHTWLPDAMEGPTPVSALIHAATMVAAGVYLAARLLQAAVLDAAALTVLAYIGAFTAVFAASIAFVQNDIKRVLAYSTISQLGYMMLAVGVGSYTAAVFHMLTHAFFKACLFLGSGSVIHAMHEGLHHVHSHADAQDMRNMGGLRRKMPWTHLTFLVSTLAIAGAPLTAGFLSKDAVLAGTLEYGMRNPGHALLPVLGFLAALMTAFYMFRLVFGTFYGEYGARASEEERDLVQQAGDHLHESPPIMTVPLVVLALGALWVFWSPANPMYKGWIKTADIPENWMQFAAAPGLSPGDTAHNLAIGLSIVVAAVGFLFALLFFGLRVLSSERFARSGFAQVLERKYGFDELYDWAFVRSLLRVCNWSGAADLKVVDGLVNGVGSVFVSARRSFTWLTGAIDRYVVDGAVNGVGRALRWTGAVFRRLQSGLIQNYLLVIFTGVAALIFIVAMGMR